MKKGDSESSSDDQVELAGEGTAADDLSIAQRIKESAGQIWLAGLGAYAKAEKEGGKLFEALVNDGKLIEARSKNGAEGGGESADEQVESNDKASAVRAQSEAQKADGEAQKADGEAEKVAEKEPDKAESGSIIDQHIATYRGLVEERVEDVKDRATNSWEKLEKAFDERVSRALGRLNIPTKADVESLAERIDALSKAIEMIAEVQLAERKGEEKSGADRDGGGNRGGKEED